VIEAGSDFKIAGIVQPRVGGQNKVLGYPVLGADDDLAALLERIPNALITVGQIKSPDTRIRLFELLKTYGARLPIIRSPTAYCSRHAALGEGSILMHASVVNAGARIGANCILNSQALVEHDAVISDHCHIATGAIVNGGVRIGPGCFIGSGAVLKQGLAIGAGAVIGAGQFVRNDVPAGKIVRCDRD
jgi:sugar O-acyltransferase (sialic acid O-acetyltransferase NeuD family)